MALTIHSTYFSKLQMELSDVDDSPSKIPTLPTKSSRLLLLLACGSFAAKLAIISWKCNCVTDAVHLFQSTLVLISLTSEG